MIKAEICANSVQSCIIAEKGGAVRVELCDNLIEGGTTPPLSHIELARESINIELNIIIRPRGGDFLYTDMEFETMKRDVHHCGKTKASGVVFGILDTEGNIDMGRNILLENIARSYGMSTTFHRAFDRCKDVFKALEDVIKIGCDRILTSGGGSNAIAGKDTLKELIKQAGDRIIIMPGAGISENNIAELVTHTQLKEFHGTFRSRYTGNMTYTKDELGSFEDEYTYAQTDIEKVKKAIYNANRA